MQLRRPVALAAAAAAALGFGGCGGDREHSGAEAASTPAGGSATPAASTPAGSSATPAAGGSRAEGAGRDASVDRAFVADMIPHHESAVAMARIGLERAQSDFVQRLARDIVRTQQAEIAAMRRIDEDLARSAEPGDLGLPEHAKGMHGDPDDLRSAKTFDAAFVDMMVPHHQGAIAMARVELARGSDPRLRRLAERIAQAQQREIDAMRAFRGDGRAAPHTSGQNRAHAPQAER